MNRIDRIGRMFLAIIIIFTVFATSLAVYSNSFAPIRTDNFELYSCDAPDGHYYSDTHGSLWSFDADLGNAYVMRYMKDGELRTTIIESTSPNMHTYLFQNGTDTMHLRVEYRYMNSNGTYDHNAQYYLYVPDPKTM